MKSDNFLLLFYLQVMEYLLHLYIESCSVQTVLKLPVDYGWQWQSAFQPKACNQATKLCKVLFARAMPALNSQSHSNVTFCFVSVGEGIFISIQVSLKTFRRSIFRK